MTTRTDARIADIAWHLPEGTLTSADLAREHPEWSPEKIEGKTGIRVRHIAAPDETSADLAVKAAERLFANGRARAADIDFVLLCTQSPDHFLPTTACLVQDRLGIPTTAGALDFNLGCSGFVYGLALAKGLVETGQARRVLLLTAETYSKFIHPGDRSVRTIFGDAAAATLIEGRDPDTDGPPSLGPFVFGTDGRGAPNLIVPAGGMRLRSSPATAEVEADADGNLRAADHLYMNGAEIFHFTLATVAESVTAVLVRAGLGAEAVDAFVFHQANAYMLEHLRRKLALPKEKFVVDLADCGNTVSSTIPIALERAVAAGRIRPGHRVLLAGFGVGYSWSSALAVWR